ncbi:MAG: hypothetical protein AAB373_03210 [Patescibacteria group bacterium]
MEENPKQKFEKIETRFQSIAKDVDKHVLSEEVEKTIDAELGNIIKEIKELRQRREILLYKPKLSTEEQEEFAALNDLMDDIQDLGDLLSCYIKNQELSKTAIVETENVKAMIALKDTYKISNPKIVEIYHKLKIEDLRRKNPEFASISKLTITDADIDAIADDSAGDNSLFTAILFLSEYCTLTPQQQERLNKYAIKCSPYEDSYLFTLLLSKLPLNREQQNTMISGLTAYTTDHALYESGKDPKDSRFGGDWNEGFSQFSSGFFFSEILNSKHLPDEQKQKIASCLIQMGSGTDCEYLLKTYPKFIDAKTKKLAQERIKASPENKDLSIPSLYEATPETFKGKSVYFIVHPFYGPRAGAQDKDQLKKYGGNVEKMFEASFIVQMRNLVQKTMTSKTGLKGAEALGLIREIREFKRYKELISSPKNVVIFALQKVYASDPQAEGDFYNVMSDFNQGKGNVFYLQTNTKESGDMMERDSVTIDRLIPKNSDITVQGGLIGRCLEGFTSGLTKLEHKRRIILDYSDSKGAGAVDDSGFANLPSFIPLKNPEDIKTMEDVEKILEANSALINAYDNLVINAYKRKPKNDPGHSDFYVAHQK